MTLLLLLLSAVWATGLLPGRWPITALLLILLLGHIAAGEWMRRRHYIRFEVKELPRVDPQPLDASQSLPVYVTGRLRVEGAERQFTCLPGFYKTFATREHALLCQARNRKVLGILSWPIEEVGMWYAFFEPDAIKSVTGGILRFAAEPMKSLAVEYEICQTVQKRIGRKTKEECIVETIYIASQDDSVIQRIAADLLSDESLREHRINHDVSGDGSLAHAQNMP